MLEKQIAVDLVEVVGNNTVQVRTKTSIVEDGKELSFSYHRHSIAPGQDYSAEDAKVQAICSAVHTPETIAAYEAAVEAAKPVALEE
jgi:hypothetical protein